MTSYAEDRLSGESEGSDYEEVAGPGPKEDGDEESAGGAEADGKGSGGGAALVTQRKPMRPTITSPEDESDGRESQDEGEEDSAATRPSPQSPCVGHATPARGAKSRGIVKLIRGAEQDSEDDEEDTSLDDFIADEDEESEEYESGDDEDEEEEGESGAEESESSEEDGTSKRPHTKGSRGRIEQLSAAHRSTVDAAEAEDEVEAKLEAKLPGLAALLDRAADDHDSAGVSGSEDASATGSAEESFREHDDSLQSLCDTDSDE